MTMNLLINSEEVLAAAFTPVERVSAGIISDAAIEAAQLRYLKPVFGGMYDKFIEGEYADFVGEYLRDALAYYVKADMAGTLAVQFGGGGLFRPKNDHLSPATVHDAEAVRMAAKRIADTLLDRAVGVVEADPAAFHGYAPGDNVRNRICLRGGVVIKGR